jgi:N-acetylglucosaminyl-diphospho-decaprenol L-rhamnosyltransferase
MHLAVIILNYNTRDLLRRCIASVLASAALNIDHVTVEVMVVDNASPDGSAQMVATEFPQIYLIASPENLGYTGGNNLALQLLGFPVDAPPHPVTPSPCHPLTLSPDFALLLNADAEISGGALWQMAKVLQDRPGVGVCGAQLRYGDGTFQHGAFQFPTLFQLALDFFPLSRSPGAHRLHNSRLNGRYPRRLWQGTEPFPVDFVLGAAMMVRGTAIQQVGGLDDEYYLYCEEMDWCLRMAEAGWRVVAAPAAQVIHHEGQSSRQVRWSAYERLWRSRFRFYQKHARHYPPGYVWLVRGVVRCGLWSRRWQAWQRFGRGEITGVQVQDELKAYQTIARL